MWWQKWKTLTDQCGVQGQLRQATIRGGKMLRHEHSKVDMYWTKGDNSHETEKISLSVDTSHPEQ